MVKYKRPITINIGVIIFFIIFLYIIINVFIYMNKEHISIYEVSENKIADDNICKGVILREEKIYYSEYAGYVNYFLREEERVAKNSIIYTVDESGHVLDTLSSTEEIQALSNSEKQKILDVIHSYQKFYSEDEYYKIYHLKYDIENILYDATNYNMITNLGTIESSNENSNFFYKVFSQESGIVSYSMDHMETLSAEQVTSETFTDSNYEKKQLRSSELLEKNSPIYKLVTDEAWSIIISLTKEQYERIQSKTQIKITFLKDGLSTVTPIESYQKGDSYFARLDLENYMIRYINDRFIDIELTINSAQGLKIPNSSIIQKDFYKIPLDFFTQGGDSNNTGVIKMIYDENGELEHRFIPTEIYYEEDGFGFIDTNIIYLNDITLKSGDAIYNEKTSENYTISQIGSLEGVYNVNKGYTVFRRIEKEYENAEYCIVRMDTPYGLSVYDHIVLNGNQIEEQSIIY